MWIFRSSAARSSGAVGALSKFTGAAVVFPEFTEAAAVLPLARFFAPLSTALVCKKRMYFEKL